MSFPSCAPSDPRVESLDTSTVASEGRPKGLQQQSQRPTEESEKARTVAANNEDENEAVYLAEIAERRKMRGNDTASTVDIPRLELQAKAHYRYVIRELPYNFAFE